MPISRKWVGNLPNVLTTRGAIANIAAKKAWLQYIYAPHGGPNWEDGKRRCIDAWHDHCEVVLADPGLYPVNQTA